MKKMNNKGFAISSLLYGLLVVGFLTITLLMSSLSINRKNTKILIEQIEEELGRYGRTTVEFKSSDQEQEFIVPYLKGGWYKIELWYRGSPSVYTSAVVKLSENQHLSIDVKVSSPVSVYAKSKGEKKEILKTSNSPDNQTFSGLGIIDGGDIERKFGMKVDISDPGSSKVKIQLLTTENSLPTTTKYFSGSDSNYSYYIKFSDDNFITESGNNIIATTLDAQLNNQEWIINAIPSTVHHKIISPTTGKVLAINDSGNLVAEDFVESKNKQLWKLNSVGTDIYYLQNADNNQYLYFNGSSLEISNSHASEIEIIKSDY